MSHAKNANFKEYLMGLAFGNDVVTKLKNKKNLQKILMTLSHEEG